MRSRKWMILAGVSSLPLIGIALLLGPFRLFEHRGKMFERHSVTGTPDIEIYITGFVDSSFATYLVDKNGRRELIAPVLPCNMKLAEFRLKDRRGTSRTNFILAPAIRTVNGEALFEVFWAKDL